jgi:hypothetical protein
LPRKNVTKTDVITAADAIAAKGEIPTIAAIRKFLGGVGSETTLHKYLKGWKEKKLLQITTNETSNINEQDIKVKLAELKQIIASQQQQNEVLSQEAFTLNRENTKLITIKQQLELELTSTQVTLKEITQERDKFQALYEAIAGERELANNYILANRDQQITRLQEELSNLHHKSLELVRTTGYDGHVALMEEKVKTINLQTKIDEISIQLKNITHELQQTKEVNEKLTHKIKRMQGETSLALEKL